MKAVVLALALCVLTTSCAKGSDALFPRTRQGWGVAVIVVGAAWIVAGAAIAADSHESTRARTGGSLVAGAVGALLIFAGWKLGDFGNRASTPPPAPAQ